MKKIIIFIPYYGKLKNYFQFFLESVKVNSTINWLLMTDDKTKYSYPDNMQVIYNSFEEFKALIQKKFDFEICLPNPYKLCDYKPAYGYIMDEYFRGYDFWGFCDIDIIFGDIRHFVTDDILNKYTRIFQFGHLSLFKNTDEWNTLFMRANNLSDYIFDDYKAVFSNEKIYFFDEFNPSLLTGTVDMWTFLYPDMIYRGLPMDHIWGPIGARFVFRSKMNALDSCLVFSFSDGKLYRFYLKDNQIFKEESLYLHMHLWSMKINSLESTFLIVPGEFIPYQSVNEKLLKKYTKKKHIQYWFYKVKYKLSKISK